MKTLLTTATLALLASGHAKPQKPQYEAEGLYVRSADNVEFADEQDGQYREELYSNNVNTIPGTPGTDYPTLAGIPKTGFTCADKLPGFYADEEARCQVWHYCKTDGFKESFLCPNGTVYNQANRVCEWWFNVLCENTSASYRVNEDLYIIPSSTETPDAAGVPVHYKEEPLQYHHEPDYYTA
ncbi:uncharacterized protein LOC108674075 isoform X2 [Hyalella azteca]|uniref:Uncharacterized protein LOC108674075 isoform X2 n=1 Tax=Hyalella azteca TaxID=294128 RepID=A0A8B7NUQ1_HYAAZ|nr:uncharacterized protein LOC108674075 isoform X2 [Hyalella azteca]